MLRRATNSLWLYVILMKLIKNLKNCFHLLIPFSLTIFFNIFKPIFNFELTQYKTSETNPLQIQQHFAEIRSVTSEYSAKYTGCSTDSDRVASTAVFGE